MSCYQVDKFLRDINHDVGVSSEGLPAFRDWLILVGDRTAANMRHLYLIPAPPPFH